MPTKKNNESVLWRNYIHSIDNITDVDLVLVDGRFRVACVINSLISHPNAIVLLYDFFDPLHHRHYRRLIEVTDIIERADTFPNLRRKRKK
jgi:hypothetical protein